MLFGKAGAGKSYAGQLIGNTFNCYYFEGDLVIPYEMSKAILEQKAINESMLEVFLGKNLRAVVEKLHKSKHQPLVVSQAFYLYKYRDQYRELFGEKIQFILIDAYDDKCYERLQKRKGWITVDYAKKMRLRFQPPEPDEKCVILDNSIDSDINIITQFSKISDLEPLNCNNRSFISVS